MHLIGGVAATLATLFAVSPLAKRGPRYVSVLMAGVILLATLPSIGIFVTPSLPTAQILLWILVPAIYFFIGPTMGLIQNVVAPEMRAQAIAVLLFVANLFNLVVAPQLVGIASDVLAPHVGGNTESLRWALIGLAPTGFWAAWHYWAGAKALRST